MDLSFVMHRAPILIGDYQFHDSLKKEVLSLLESSYFISKDNTNVKATRTDWNWNPDNIKIRNLKSYIREEIERVFAPGKIFGKRMHLVPHNFWANIQVDEKDKKFYRLNSSQKLNYGPGFPYEIAIAINNMSYWTRPERIPGDVR